VNPVIPSGPEDAADAIIVALDSQRPPPLALAPWWIACPTLRWVKVGLEVVHRLRAALVIELRRRGLRCFLDLKFHDTQPPGRGWGKPRPALGAELITVHVCRRSQALAAAQAAAVAERQAGLPASHPAAP